MAVNRPIFDRLIGLETEYAVRFLEDARQRPSNRALFFSLVHALKDRLPIAATHQYHKKGFFLANGGAVWLEAVFNARRAGLIEGSTAECRGPRQAVVYQQAQDRLLAEAARSVTDPGRFVLLKNDRDSRGNIYGAQENYEVSIATGARLWLWRAGLVALTPLMALTWIGLVLLFGSVILWAAAAGLIYLLISAPLPAERRQRLALAVFGPDLVGGNESLEHPPLLERIIAWEVAVVLAPLTAAVAIVLHSFAFSSIRRRLTPLLISRAAVAGAGTLDRQGRFHLADKAPGINCVLGFNSFVYDRPCRLWIYDRPIYSCGHILRNMLAPGSNYAGLFARQQRLQICLGDANMAQTAEYLRVGTTALVLDAMDAGYLRDVPRVRRPIRTLHRVIADPELKTTVAVHGGRPMNAMDVQRFYLEACRKFLAARPDAPDEAWDILHRWRDVLDRLENDRQSLVGTVDWITKQFLLDRAGGDDLSRKKIDLRYHELSPEGYFARLTEAGAVADLLGEEEIGRAMRMPPADPPAAARGRFIREFSGGAEALTVDWRHVVLGSGKARRTVELSGWRRFVGEGEDRRRGEEEKGRTGE